MKKKKLVLLMFGLCTFFLVGCEKVIDLTEEETQLIAEYSAELLLKYDLNYIDRIVAGQEKIDTSEEENDDEVTSETNEQNEERTETPTKTDNAPSTDNDNISDAQNSVGTQSNIAVIAGIDGADITFQKYSFVDKYPATDEQGDFIYLEAPEGYQLLILYFEVSNHTEELLPISLLDKELDYRIVCNGSKAAKPMLTILMDDLGTLETNVEPGATQNAVLVFQLSDGMREQLETMDLYVTYNETDNLIKILQ